MTTFAATHPPTSVVFGAYSLWPRRQPRTNRRRIVTLAALGAAGLFAHCVLPMLTSL